MTSSCVLIPGFVPTAAIFCGGKSKLFQKTPFPFLVLGLLGFTASLSAQTELISNHHFADGGASWVLKTDPEAMANVTVEEESGEQALCVNVLEVSGDAKTAPDVRVQHLFGEIAADKYYRVFFQVKAAEPATIVAYIYPEDDSAKVLWRKEIKTDMEWHNHSFTFKGRATADNCVLGFARLGKMANKYWFKDVALRAD